jgi:hypothetical protein
MLAEKKDTEEVSKNITSTQYQEEFLKPVFVPLLKIKA